MFCLEQTEHFEAWKHWYREEEERKRAERLASFKEYFRDLCTSLRRTRVRVQCVSHNLLHSFDAKADTHPLHNGDDDHSEKARSRSITVRLLSRVVNSRRCGYLKVGKDSFKGRHASEDLESLWLGEKQVSGGVTEIVSKDSVVGTHLSCYGRPVCISAEQF